MTVTPDQIRWAEAAGRAAARGGKALEDCPYPANDRVLRLRWVLAYASEVELVD